MSHLKRLISLILTMLLVLGTVQFTASAAEGNQGIKSNEKVFVLSSLKIFDVGFNTDATMVTRGEMAMLTMRLLGVTEPGFAASEFADVDSHTPYASYISHAKSMGIMNGIGANFMPQRYISGYEAAKTLVSALGYDAVAISKGGYPAGYIVCASELGLLNNTVAVSSEAISCADVITMLYNALNVKPMQPVYGDEDNYRKDDSTLGQILEDRYELVYIEGILNASSKASIDAYVEPEEGYVLIGGNTYKYNGDDICAYLAYPLMAYADSKNNLVGFCVNNENFEEITLSPSDISDISLTGVSYYESASKEKSFNVDTNAPVVYNGKLIKEPTADDIVIYCGSLRFVNNDDDKTYEAIFVEESTSVVIESVYKPNNSIYFKSPFVYNGRSSLTLNADRDGYEYTVTKPDGTIGSIDDITSSMTATLTQSKDGKITYIKLSDKTISGTLEEKNDSRHKAVISGTEYELALSENGTPWLSAPLGTTSVFLVDADGRIVHESEDSQGENFAFVSAMSKPSGMAQPRIQLRTSGKSVREEKVSGNSIIVSYKYQNGEVLELDFASKVRFNGIGVTPSEISQNALVDKLIKYKLDSDGKLKTIDTYDSYNDRASMNFNAEIISFGGRADRDSFLVASSTKVLCVPNYPDSNDDWNQTVKCTDEGSYTVYGAEINPETGIAGAVVIYANMDADALVPIDEDTDISMVVSSSQIMDEEGDAVYRVHILTGNTENYIMTGTNKTAEDATAALRPGDLIRYSTDVDGRIANLELLASVQDLDRFYRANANSTNEEIYGRVTNVEVGKLSRIKNEFVDKITIATNEWLTNGVSYELVRKDGAVMYICNPSAKTVRAATGRDMLGSEQFGVAESSKVFMLVKNNDPQVVVVIE